MVYIPSNRIQTNLYTNGTEYQIGSTGVIYVGSYWKIYTGEAFTGKNPNEKPSQRLIPINLSSDNTFQNNKVYSFVEIDDIPKPLVTEYLNIKNIDYTTLTQNLPSQYYPSPTPQDYQLGVFQRYFVYRINTIEFTEVDKETYENIKTKNSNWAWKFYDYFSIPWELTGNKERTYTANRNIVLIAERRNRAPGLGKFLRENYLKFYKG